ncbi:hypothetical protein [Ilumatobacter sp.]|uniref:hypothetical protein n=1 Tax=Ilumatobacter sp. TaxID=1967498 RepID=UPI003AF98C59
MGEDLRDDVECLLFDVGGSIFDWQTAIVRSLDRVDSTTLGALDPQTFASTWRRRSLMHMYAIATERVPWRPFDEFIVLALTEALDEHEVGSISASDRSTLERAWRAMPVWPEVVPSIARLKTRYVVAPHTILSLAAVAHSSKIAGLDWDAIVSCDAIKVTKTNPDSYLGAARTIGFDVDRICYVAAHTSDLDVASGLGLRTAFVQPRLDEYGEEPTGAVDRFDVFAVDYADLADQLV